MSLRDYLHNETKTGVLRFVIFVVIFVIIIDQLFNLTMFAYNYTKCYDYGDLMKKTCNTNYTEYETNRFHIAKNIVELKANNDNYKYHFDILIPICTIILSLYMTSFLIYLMINTSFDAAFISFVSGAISSALPGMAQTASSLDSSYVDNISTYISNMSLIQILMLIAKIIIILYLILITPIYFLLKYKYEIDLSPFKDISSDGLLISIYTINSLLVSIIIGLKLHQPYISSVTDFISIVLAIGTFLLMTMVVDIHVSETNKNTNEDQDQSNLILFSNRYSVDIKNIDTNITLKYLSDVFGLNDFTLSPNKYNHKGIISILLIFLVVVIILYWVLKWFKNDSYFSIFASEDYLDADILYHNVFIPFLILTLIIFTVIATKEYNTYINKYIIYRPYNLYNRSIAKINDIFEQILENDKANVENNSVCRNVVNAINLSLYSAIFYGIQGTSTGAPLQKEIIPKMEYDRVCDINDYTEYHKLSEYDFQNNITINGTHILQGQDNKCSSIENKMIIQLFKSITPKYETKLEESDLETYRQELVKHMLFAVTNVKNLKTYSGKRNLVITDNFKNNNLIEKIDINNKFETIDDEQTIILIYNVATEYIKYIKIVYNLIMRTTQGLCKCNKIEDFTNKGYNEWMKKIDETIEKDTNGSYSLSIKKSFIIKFTSLTQRFFMKINEHMSQQIKVTEDNYKLSRYIIQNYNGYQNETYKIHRSKTFEEIEYYTDPVYKPHEDIEDVQKIIQELKEVIEKLDKDINEIKEENNDQIIELKKKFILEASNKLSTELENLKNAQNIFKELYNREHKTYSNYDDEFIFKYKNEYIDAHYELHKDKIQKLSNNNTSLGFDIKEYIIKYEEINESYMTQYEAIYKISNNIYKTEAELSKNRDIEVEEEVYSRSLLSMATTTSQNIYTLIVIYIVLILTANIVE